MLADRPFDRLDASGSSSGRRGESPRPSRSTWPHSPDYDPEIELFARIRVGLITGEHRLRLNDATFLFLYLHSTCYFTGPLAGTSVATYTHVAAAKHLYASTRQVKRWMETLVDGGYVTTARTRYGLTVTITKYGFGEGAQAVELDGSKATRSDTYVTSDRSSDQSPINPEVTPAVRRSDIYVTSDRSITLDPINAANPEVTSAVSEVTSAVRGSDTHVTSDRMSDQPPTDPEVTCPVLEVTPAVPRSDTGGQPLIYVARAFRDSEKKERVVTKRDTSPPSDLSPLAVGAVPVDGAGVRVASRRASPSPWGLLTSDDPPRRVEPVEHVAPPVIDTVTDTVAATVAVSAPEVAKAAPKPRVRKAVAAKPVSVVGGHVPDMPVDVLPEPVVADPVPETGKPVWDAEAMPLGEVPEASTAIVLVTRATVTDVTPVALAPRRRAAVKPVTEANLVMVAKEPTKQTQVIDLLRADPRLVQYAHLAPRDFAAIKRSSLTPAQIVEVYGGLCLGEWGSDWDQKHVRVDHAIGCWAQYQRTRDAVTQAERDIETLLAAHAVPWVMTERDRTLIRDVTKRRQSPLGAEEIVAAYEGLLNGTWGSDWLRSNVSITKAIESFGSYQASLRPRAHDPSKKKTHDQEWADIFAERDKLMPEGSVQ